MNPSMALTQSVQSELFKPDLTTGQLFDAWKETPGARRVLQMAYAIAAGYARRFQRNGRRVSMTLVFEILRDNVAAVISRRRGLKLEKVDGFVLNNNFRPYMARHIIAHKPEWAGLFEMRELTTETRSTPRKKRTIIVIDEFKNEAPEPSGGHHAMGRAA